MTNDYIHNLWKHIVSELSKAKDIQTVRRKTAGGIWFSAHSESGSVVIINEAKIKKPSAKLNCLRAIDEREFSEVYPHYQPWKKGKIQRQSMRDLSQNTSYILALINRFEKDNHGGLI